MNTIDSRKYDTVLKGCDIEFYTTIESLHINNKYMFRLVPDFQYGDPGQIRDINKLILSAVKTKKVKVEQFGYVRAKVNEMLKDLDTVEREVFSARLAQQGQHNPIAILNEYVLCTFQKHVVSRVVSKKGRSCNPIVTVKIIVPSIGVFTGSGMNKNNARRKASVLALKEFGFKL